MERMKMNQSGRFGDIFAGIALAMLLYCLVAYLYIQSILQQSMPEPDRTTRIIGDLTVPALFFVGLYHLYLLVNLLKRLTDRIASVFRYSLGMILIVLSGLSLVSDWTLLSDIGKEYLLADVGPQWLLLYGFTAFHGLVIIFGTLFLKSSPLENGKLFDDIGNGRDVLFLSIHHIASIAGILGIVGVVFAASGLLVPLRFLPQFIVVLSGLALFPLVLIVIYWIVKMRKKPLKQWIDERQIADTALAALFCLLLSIPIYLLVFFMDLFGLFASKVSFWIALIFFIQLAVFSMVVSLRNSPSQES